MEIVRSYKLKDVIVLDILLVVFCFFVSSVVVLGFLG